MFLNPHRSDAPHPGRPQARPAALVLLAGAAMALATAPVTLAAGMDEQPTEEAATVEEDPREEAGLWDQLRREVERLREGSAHAAGSAGDWWRQYASPEAWRERYTQMREGIDDAIAEHTGIFVLREVEGQTPGVNSWLGLDAAEPLQPHLVVLVHGLDEPGTIWDELAPALRERGLEVARFDYPNDQSIACGADLLAEKLRELRTRGVERVDLIGHSMGGLVARDVLTRAGHYGGRGSGHADLPTVSRLITVATPHHGSEWARLRFVTELREQAVRLMDSDLRDLRLLLAFLAEGAGEARKDLLPGSAYLQQLNGRPLPEDVPITVIAGEVAPIEAERTRQWLEGAAGALLSEEQSRRLAENLERWAGSVGDGVVSLESARLEGVRDMVIVSANHRGILRTLGVEQAARSALGRERARAPAIDVILDRLLSDSPAPQGREHATRD